MNFCSCTTVNKQKILPDIALCIVVTDQLPFVSKREYSDTPTGEGWVTIRGSWVSRGSVHGNPQSV